MKMSTINLPGLDGEAVNPVVQFYDGMGDYYLNWSASLQIHFGYFRLGINPFRLETMLDEMTHQVLERLNLCTEAPVIVDAGCGVGAAARLMSAACPGAKFYGVTISPWQVAYGKSVIREKALDGKIFLLHADFHNMPFSNGFADAAFAIESACYARGKDKKAFINELARILKPNGRLVIIDGFKKHSAPLPAFLDKIYRRYLDLWALEDLAEMNLFKETLKEAGYEQIQAKDISWNVAPTALHIPVKVLKLWLKTRRLKKQTGSPVPQNYIKALLLTLFMGLWKRHFGYFIVTCNKK